MNNRPKVLIVYATWTGNTEEIANLLFQDFQTFDCEVNILECQQVNATDFLAVDICVIASYTFGSAGELPDEMYPFYDEMKGLNLTGKVYGVLGSGDLYYEWYCKAVDDFDKQFAQTGALKGVENLKIDTSADEADKIKIVSFARELLNTWKSIN